MALLPLLIFPLLLPSTVALRDLGEPNWKCDPSVMKKSATPPKSAHSVRYADIGFVAALGDSLTAGNGAGAAAGDINDVNTEYRGLTFSVGGDKTLEEHVTLANVIKKFNPVLVGYSTGKGTADQWGSAQLNGGIPGATAAGLLHQAAELVKLFKTHYAASMAFKWKLIHIFIGSNDVCAWCAKPDSHAPARFREFIRETIQYLQKHLPKTIVVLTGALDPSGIAKMGLNNPQCAAMHKAICPCFNKTIPLAEITAISQKMLKLEKVLEETGEFDDKEDFTLVIQPFFEQLEVPKEVNGISPLEFFAPDCFHLSQYGHAVIGKNLWNSVIKPVRSKPIKTNVDNIDFKLGCPDPTCPFLRTIKNSKDCKKFMTPTA